MTPSGGVVEDRCRHNHFKSLPLSPRAASPHRTNYIIQLAMYKYNNNILYTAVKNISYYIMCGRPHRPPPPLLPLLTLLQLPLLQLPLPLFYPSISSRPHCHALHPLAVSQALILFARSTQFQLKSLRYQFIIRDNNIHNHLFIYMYMYIILCIYSRVLGMKIIYYYA